jgi:hypothetical protein
MKRRGIRFTALLVALAMTVLVCHVGRSVYAFSKYSDEFNTDESQVTFKELVLYAAYLRTPDSFDSRINKLRQIDGAKQEWAVETKASPDATPKWDDIQPYLGRGAKGFLPLCP